jgi:NAD(P)-dependent dehydrogenase (short-subunit alcohol dehydrogenase family)
VVSGSLSLPACGVYFVLILTYRCSHDIASKEHQFSLEEVSDLSGKVAVITGGTAGIGYACSHTMLSKNIAHLFIISSNQASWDDALKTLSRDMGEGIGSKITYLQCDMADWPAVARTAKKIAEQTPTIDILINDAGRGIMTYQLTDYGVDRHMAVNHMGHVILTSHLLPTLKSTAEKGSTVRLVGLGSNTHQATPSDCKFASLEELNQDLGPNGQYGRSKLAVMLYHRYLARHLSSTHPKILSNSVHPGFVDTKMSAEDIHEPYPIAGYAMSVGMKPFKKDQWMGAVSAMYCATKTERTGEYVCPPAVPEPGNALAQDEKLGEALMALTRKVIKEKMDPQEKGCPLEMF